MNKIILLLFLCVSSPVHAWNNWSESDKALFVASSVAMTADWATTRYAARHNWPNGLHETNIFMGRYPNQDQVDLYFTTLLVANYFIADYFKGNTRTFYLIMRTGVHGSAANKNIGLGMKLRF